MGNYLARIQNGTEYPTKVKLAAARLESSITVHEEIGILMGARFNQAADAALERYSPRAQAPAMT